MVRKHAFYSELIALAMVVSMMSTSAWTAKSQSNVHSEKIRGRYPQYRYSFTTVLVKIPDSYLHYEG